MAKVSRRARPTVYFATKHGKEEVLRPLLKKLGFNCVAVAVDTDRYGTFSGEVERPGSIRETLRLKIAAAREFKPRGRYFLASEGSFGPHPVLGFMDTDLESLLFLDRKLELEIYAEHLSLDPTHAQASFGPSEDYEIFLRNLGFPEQAVIVFPEGAIRPIFKGLTSLRDVQQAMLECFMVAKTGRVMIATDLRAHHNPVRRLAIAKAGEQLVERLLSKCPACDVPGFAITRGIPGLPCEACGEPSGVAAKVLWECAKCTHSEERDRVDGMKSISPDECEYCNP